MKAPAVPGGTQAATVRRGDRSPAGSPTEADVLLGGVRRDRARVRRRLAVPLLAAAVIVVPGSLSDYGNSVLLAVSVNVIAACGLHVLVHWTGQVSLSHAAFVGVGAFAAAALNQSHGVVLPLALLGGVFGATLTSGIVGLPALRIRGFELAVVTLAAGFAANRWLFLQSWLVGDFQVRHLEDRSLFGFDIEQPQELMVPVAALLILVLALTVWLGRSPLGRGLRMVAADERVAAAYGVNVGVHKFFGFLYAGACAGAAGVVYCLGHSRGMGTEEFPAALSILLLSAVLMGGPGPVTGTVVAAAGLGAFPVVAGGLGRWLGLVAPLGLLLTVWHFQGGLNEQFGMVRRHAVGLVDVARGRRRGGGLSSGTSPEQGGST